MKFVLLSLAAGANAYDLTSSVAAEVSARLPRTTTMQALDLSTSGVGYDFLAYTSVPANSLAQGTADVSAAEADAAASASGSASASASGIVAGLGAGTGLPPSFFMASFDFAAEASGSAEGTATTKTNAVASGGIGADVSASVGFAAMVYAGLKEVQADGTAVEFYSFASSVPLFSMSYDSSAVTTNGAVKSASLTGTHGDLSAKFTMVASSESGELSSGSLITPTSVEMLVEIEGYDYADPTNHLELVMASASASAQATGSGYAGASGGATVELTSGNGAGSMYVDFAKTATVDAKANTAVTVEVVDYMSATVGASADASAEVEGKAGLDILGDQLKGLLEVSGSAAAAGSGSASASYSVNMITVAFPAGASKITYDPTVGAGAPLSKTTSSATSAAASVVALAAALAALL